MKHESKKQKKLWTKVGGSKTSGLYRYEPSAMYVARLRIRGRSV